MSKKKTKSLSIEKLRKKTPLRIRLMVLNEMVILDMLVEMKLIPDGPWTDEKEKQYGKYREYTKKLTEYQLEEIKKWKKDGKPKEKI